MTAVAPEDAHLKDALDEVLKGLVKRLEKRRAEIGEEISSYPPPIPACDAQFNYLLEARRGIARELTQLKELAADGFSDVERRQSLCRLIEASAYLDAGAKQKLQAWLPQAR